MAFEVVDMAAAMKPLVGEQLEAFSAEHDRLLLEEVIEFVRPAHQPPRPQDKGEHLQPIFAIKQGERWRQIWNMKYSNKQLRPRPFKMTGVRAFRELVQTRDWLCTIDLKDAYCNILLKEEDRKYQRYVLNGKIWQIKTLPFGLAQAPWAFTRFVMPLLKRWRSWGLKTVAWLDDLTAAPRRPPCSSSSSRNPGM